MWPVSDLLERLTIEGMQRMRWTRKRAETEARKRLDKVKTEAQLAAFIKKLGSLDSTPPKPALKPSEKQVPGKPKLAKNMSKPKSKLTRAEIAKLPPVDPHGPSPRRRCNAWGGLWGQMMGNAGGVEALSSRVVVLDSGAGVS